MEENKSGALVVQEKNKAIKLLLNLEPKLNKITNLNIEYIDNIDSTNMKPEHWDLIADIIYKNYKKYDGFVIIQGTDTMAYTSSALSWSLQNLGKPVVLTGAQIPFAFIESDAKHNYINAVRVATMNLSGVIVVFDEEIILGSRASKISESKLNAFETINDESLGEIRVNIRLNNKAPKRHKGNLKLIKVFEPNIEIISLTPGRPVETLIAILNSGVKGIILRGFGPGNIPYEYLEAIKMANKKRIPILVSTQCLEGETAMHLYDVGKKALDLGCIETYDMSLEAITTKLMWALKHFPYEKIGSVMHKNYTGEIKALTKT